MTLLKKLLPICEVSWDGCLFNARSKSLVEITSEFERDDFRVMYDSPKQKARRLVAITVLAVKHALRGIFSTGRCTC